MANPERQNHTETSQFAQLLRNHGRLVLLILALSTTAGAVAMEEGKRNDNDKAFLWGTTAVAVSALLSTPFLADEIEVAIEKHQPKDH